MMYGYGYYDYYPFHMIGSLFMILFWIFLLIILVRFLRYGRRHGHGMWHDGFLGDKSALDILKERYAKGEITREQFHEMKKDIL